MFWGYFRSRHLHAYGSREILQVAKILIAVVIVTIIMIVIMILIVLVVIMAIVRVASLYSYFCLHICN